MPPKNQNTRFSKNVNNKIVIFTFLLLYILLFFVSLYLNIKLLKDIIKDTSVKKVVAKNIIVYYCPYHFRRYFVDLFQKEFFNGVEDIPGYTPVGCVYSESSLEKMLHNYLCNGFTTLVRTYEEKRHVIYILL